MGAILDHLSRVVRPALEEYMDAEARPVILRGRQPGLALPARGDGQRFGHLDAERLDDRMHEATPFGLSGTERLPVRVKTLESKSHMGAGRTIVHEASSTETVSNLGVLNLPG